MIHQREKLLDLAGKYNRPAPRYTSYPTAVQFEEISDSTEIDREIKRRRTEPAPYSLYFHIPFCFSLCWYCGCTKIITRDRDRGDFYLNYLEKEAALVANTIHPQSTARQIHFGGGTPTFLNPKQLRRLGEIIQHYFYVDPDVEFSVEIDPRSCNDGQIEVLAEIGVNRASLGVQDTNPDVQKAIHRIQPVEQVEEVTAKLRQHGIDHINFDLIYGLPRQTLSTFRETIRQVIALRPDRLAVYSYAHIPSIMPAQKLLKEDEFPSTEEKLGMMMYGISALPEMGYRYIGMDHFAREGDELTRALDEGTLQRNFQGYSTHAELEMIALGMSGISQGKDLFYQNEKDLGEYYRMLDEDRLPVKKVLRLTEEDHIRRQVIMEIMCRAEIRYEDFEEQTATGFQTHFAKELENLSPLEDDGLLVTGEEGFYVTGNGRLFLRNIAAVFDQYLNSSRPARFSKTV
jgi:oxygen-independent coproporphyrinogen III oxidase